MARTAKWEEKLKAITKRAMELVEEGGIDALSLKRIARDLGVAVGGLYRYFASKDELIAHLKIQMLTTYAADQQRMLGTQPISALTRLIAMAYHYQRWFAARPGPAALVSAAVSDPRHLLADEPARRVMDSVVAILQRVATELTTAGNAGLLTEGNATSRALVFWGSLQGLTQMRKLRRLAPEALDIDLIHEGLTALLIGWGADRAALPAPGAFA